MTGKKREDLFDIPEKKINKQEELKQKKLENLRLGREKSLLIRKEKALMKKQMKDEADKELKLRVKEKMLLQNTPTPPTPQKQAITAEYIKQQPAEHAKRNELLNNKMTELNDYLNQWKNISGQLNDLVSKFSQPKQPQAVPVVSQPAPNQPLSPPNPPKPQPAPQAPAPAPAPVIPAYRSCIRYNRTDI